MTRCYYPRITTVVALILAATLLTVTAGGEAKAEEGGFLTVGEPQVGFLDTVGRWSFAAEAGQAVRITAESDMFDTVLELRSPTGDVLAVNDDCVLLNSCIDATIPATGLYEVRVTAYQDGNGGTYAVEVQQASATPLTLNTATPGRLGEGGVGLWSFAAEAGQSIHLTAESEAFDTVLELRSPASNVLAENDDCWSVSTDSCIDATIPATGFYEVRVTAYYGGTGAYEVAAHTPTREDSPEPVDGALERGDRAYATGEIYDEYTLEISPGETFSAEVQSDEFDTYLVAISPSGERIGRPGAMRGGLSRALLEIARAEPGSWQVNVTSASAAETGLYRLRLDARAAGPTLVHGRLEAGDAEGRNGEYVDLHPFEAGDLDCLAVRLTGAAGLRVRLLGPDGYHAESAAISADGGVTVLDDVLSGGPHRVVVIGAADRIAADYTLEIGVGCSATGSRLETAGRTFGIFIGVSDYGGTDDLPRAADDADRFAAALVDAGLLAADNAIVLTDQEATIEGVERAVAELSSRIEPDDTFVLFFSGHGNRVPRTGREPADPDRYDETIELFDGALLDNELDELLKQIGADLTLVALDSCFSGGFAKDVIAEPGRMGLFSSEEDTESGIPHDAGGYLSLFLIDAVTGRRADTDGDGAIRAIELRQYLHERFRIDVKVSGDGVSGSPAYQHLQVDPGDVDKNDLIFRLQATT